MGFSELLREVRMICKQHGAQRILDGVDQPERRHLVSEVARLRTEALQGAVGRIPRDDRPEDGSDYGIALCASQIEAALLDLKSARESVKTQVLPWNADAAAQLIQLIDRIIGQ